MRRLTNTDEVERAARLLAALLEARPEWLLREGAAGAPVELRRGEWELTTAAGFLRLTYWGEAGARAWRVVAFGREGEKILLGARGPVGSVGVTLELVPRASVSAAREELAEARRSACGRLTALICREEAAEVLRLRLSEGARRGEPGRHMRALLRRRDGWRLAATGPVVPLGAEEADAFLTSALLWHARLEERTEGGSPTSLLLVAPRDLASATAERLALLDRRLRARVSLLEVDEELTRLTRLAVPALEELLDAAPPRLTRPQDASPGALAAAVVSLAPEAVDVIRARRGETLRFRGLAFARVRRVLGRENLWFGIGGAKRLLDDESRPDLLKLLEELKEHRRHDAPDPRHALYRAAPEAWLESLLRRDITRLDPGLRLAPLHTQFRTTRAAAPSARPVDLLALRRDGRLALVELKASEDAAHPLQGADYWRRVEAHRRAGNVARARLFGDAEISDSPPLVYLAAPALRFHRSFDTLARALAPEIEIYRYDLNEDWRSGVRVARRGRVGV